MIVTVPKRYIPKNITRKDKKVLKRELKKSRRLYKKGKYYTRKFVPSFKSKKSRHISTAKKLYGIKKLTINKHLAKKTGCTQDALHKIYKKGLAAYYSSGSRPNQTPHSWATSRLASAISGGKSSLIDFSILHHGCKHDAIAYTHALSSKTKQRFGLRKTPSTSL